MREHIRGLGLPLLTWWVLLLVVLALGCAKSSEHAKSSERATVPVVAAPLAAPKHVLSGVFGECERDCRYDFRELENERPRVKRTYGQRIEPTVTFEAVLTPLARERFKKMGEQLASAELEERYGCGTCVDGTDNTLVVAHGDGRVTEHSYDAQYPQVPLLQAVDPLLDSLDTAFQYCTSNELIEIGADCVPFEKLLEQSQSRR
jgi:hypothetical protein